MSTQTKSRPSILAAIKSLFVSEYEEVELPKELLEAQKKADKIVLETVEPIVEAKASKTGKAGKGYSKKQLDDFTDRLKNNATNKLENGKTVKKQDDKDISEEEKTMDL